MNWYYAEGGKQQGPVVDAEFDALIRTGKVRPETLVWREGLTGWKQLREVMPEAAAAAATPFIPTPGLLQCGECGKEFAPDQVVRINDQWICAACKPIRLQRLMEGSAPTPIIDASGGTVPLEDVRERDYDHDLGDYLTKAWALFKADPGSLIGVTVVVYLCIFAGSMVPVVGGLVSMFITGPLMAGLYLFVLAKLRGGSPQFGDAFKGFGPRFWQLMLANMVPSLLAALCLIPVGLVFGIGLALLAPAARNGGGSGPVTALIAVGAVMALIGLCAMIYLSVCWIFTIQLVADKGMRFWPAMGLSRAVVRKHWWQNLLVVFVAGLVGGVGVFLCVVGLVITAPVAVAMTAYAYERLFGDMTPTDS